MRAEQQCPQCNGFREYIMTINGGDLYYCDTCEIETVRHCDIDTPDTRRIDAYGE